MPLYDYVCDTCGNKWDAFHSVNVKLYVCPECGGENIHKLIGSVGYRTDHTWDK